MIQLFSEWPLDWHETFGLYTCMLLYLLKCEVSALRCIWARLITHNRSLPFKVFFHEFGFSSMFLCVMKNLPVLQQQESCFDFCERRCKAYKQKDDRTSANLISKYYFCGTNLVNCESKWSLKIFIIPNKLPIIWRKTKKNQNDGWKRNGQKWNSVWYWTCRFGKSNHPCPKWIEIAIIRYFLI